MESEDDDDDDPLVMVGGQQLPYSQISKEIVAKMTQQERDEWVRIGQEMYSDMYD